MRTRNPLNAPSSVGAADLETGDSERDAVYLELHAEFDDAKEKIMEAFRMIDTCALPQVEEAVKRAKAAL